MTPRQASHNTTGRLVWAPEQPGNGARPESVQLKSLDFGGNVLAEPRVVAPSARDGAVTENFYGVPSVAADGDPLEIAKAIVGLDSVLVVANHSPIGLSRKRGQNHSMNMGAMLYAGATQCHLPVAITTLRLEDHSSRSPLAANIAPYSPEIGNRVGGFVPGHRNRKPAFRLEFFLGKTGRRRGGAHSRHYTTKVGY